jgi:tripartite-type tricarboxylate transporter receptor subunit TctC
VKAIAILTRQRSPVLPDVATAIEQGFDVEAYTWNGFFLPRGTPDAIVQKLNHAIVEAMKTPEVRAKLESAGLQFVSEDRTTPDYLAKFVQDEIAKWAVPIKAGGISVD